MYLIDIVENCECMESMKCEYIAMRVQYIILYVERKMKSEGVKEESLTRLL